MTSDGAAPYFPGTEPEPEFGAVTEAEAPPRASIWSKLPFRPKSAARADLAEGATSDSDGSSDETRPASRLSRWLSRSGETSVRTDSSVTSDEEAASGDDPPGRFAFVTAITQGRRFETRVGIATLLSFLVLVSSLVVSSRKKRVEPLKKSPADGAVARSTETPERPARSGPQAGTPSRTTKPVPPVLPPAASVIPPKNPRTIPPAKTILSETPSTEPESPPKNTEVNTPITTPPESPTEAPSLPHPAVASAATAGDKLVAATPPASGNRLLAIPPPAVEAAPLPKPADPDPTPQADPLLADPPPPPKPADPDPTPAPKPAETDLPPPPKPAEPAPSEPPSGGSVPEEKKSAPVSVEAPSAMVVPETSQPPLPEPPPAPPREIPKPVVDSGEWVPLPNLGKHFRPADGPVPHPVAAATSGGAEEKEQVGDATPIQPIEHVAARGEDFAAISKQYYASDRYARALWAANKSKVATMDDLLAGTTVRIPPMEALDPSLIDPARIGASGARVDPEASRVADRPSDGFTILPVGRPSMIREAARRAQAEVDDDEPERPTKTRYPTYVASKIDTFRSIARKTLGDSDRADEIRRLNLDIVDDSHRPRPGQKLKLPLDAKIPR